MSATEVIEMFKALPAEERREVEAFVRQYREEVTAVVREECSAVEEQDSVRFAAQSEVKASLGAVMNEYAPLFRKLAE